MSAIGVLEDDERRPSGSGATVAAFDAGVDRLFEPLRGRAPVDAAARIITGVGDHGWLWTGVAIWRGRRSGPARRQAIRSPGNAFLYTAAGLIAVSRIHLRAHHASDVAGGVVIGTALGMVVRRLR